MRFVKRILITIVSLPLCMSVSAYDADTTNVTYTIVDHITVSGLHSVSQPDALSKRLVPPQQLMSEDGEDTSVSSSPTVGTRTGGYRIQVFSDSNPRTARNEANAKAGNIASRFPEYRSYVTYDAPYWRLRVGDFRTYESAKAALAALKDAFPSYKRELRVVRDRININ